jgi:cell division septal protein FtsQ
VAGVLVWGAGLAWHAWQDSSYLRVQAVRFEGDIPIRLPASVPVKAGARLFSFSSRQLEQEELRRFPELASLSIHRTFDRALVVQGRFRQPVALLDPSTVPTGIDPQGIAFPIPPDRVPERPLPLVAAAPRDRANAIACLGAWQKKIPAFFDVVKKLECDRMRTFHVELSDGVMADLGDLDAANAVDKGQKILRLLESFSPGKSPAHLKFVTDDRIVMDNAWKPREGGNNLVKN